MMENIYFYFSKPEKKKLKKCGDSWVEPDLTILDYTLF